MFTPPKVLVIPRKRWLSPNMTEKLFTGALSVKQTKPKFDTKRFPSHFKILLHLQMTVNRKIRKGRYMMVFDDNQGIIVVINKN